MLSKWADRLDNVLVFLAGAVIIFMLTVTTISVIGRYFFNAPISDDLVINELLMVMIVFLPMAYVQRHDGHVYVTLFTDWLPKETRRKFELFGLVVGAIFVGIAAWATFTDFYAAYQSGAYMEGPLELPESPSRFAIFLGLALFFLRIVMGILSHLNIMSTDEEEAS